MKREGRQHGLVRSYRILPEPFNPRPASRSINRFDSPPTAGLFTKVSPKPTNHSKFTGKCARPRCAGCHIHPASKSKDKVKGTHKLRSCDVVSNHRLVTWRVADVKPGLKLSGFSATGILDHLASTDYCTDEDEDEDEDEENNDACVDEVYEESCELAHHDGSEVPSGAVEMEDGDDDNCEDVDEDGMSFCDVALVWERADEDEGWCLVGEM